MIHICKWVQRQIKCQKDKISIIFYELYNSVNHQKFNFEKSSVRLFHIVNEYNLGCWGGGGGESDEGQFYLKSCVKYTNNFFIYYPKYNGFSYFKEMFYCMLCLFL